MSTLLPRELADKMALLAEHMLRKRTVQLNLGKGVSHRGTIIQLSLEGRVVMKKLSKEIATCWVSDIVSIETQPTIERVG